MLLWMAMLAMLRRGPAGMQQSLQVVSRGALLRRASLLRHGGAARLRACVADFATSAGGPSTSGGPPAFEVPRRFVPFPFSYHEEIELTIDGLTALGMGVGRVHLAPELLARQEELQQAAGRNYTNKKSGRRRRSRDKKKKGPLSADAEWASYGEGGPTGEGEAEDASNGSDGEEEVTEEVEDTRGWAVIVPFCLPGELVRVRVYKNDKRLSHADLIEVLEKSAERTEARCPLYGQCGGCQYQHLAYESQLEWKTRQVRPLTPLATHWPRDTREVPRSAKYLEPQSAWIPKVR